jgi:hypothetical protein
MVKSFFTLHRRHRYRPFMLRSFAKAPNNRAVCDTARPFLAKLLPGRVCAHGTYELRMRFRVQPRDVPRDVVARRLGLSEAQFESCYANLIARGFPAPDPDTGNFDIFAVDRWCDARHPHLFGGDAIMQARDASTVAKDRIAKLKAAGGG